MGTAVGPAKLCCFAHMHQTMVPSAGKPKIAQFLILCLFWNSFSVLPLNCNGPWCYRQGSSCLAQFVFLPSCTCLHQTPGNWSLTPQHKYSHLKDAFSLCSLNAGCFIHKSHYNLAVASEFQCRLHNLGCLESLLCLPA